MRRRNTAEVRLKNGEAILVDARDRDVVSAYLWRVEVYGVKRNRTVIAKHPTTKSKIRLTHLVLSLPKGQHVEFKDGNPLNCRRSNLVTFRAPSRCSQCGSDIEKLITRLQREAHADRFCSKRCYDRFKSTDSRHLAHLRRISKKGVERIRGVKVDMDRLAKQTRNHHYPHVPISDVASYLKIKQATRKVEQCLTQTK